MRLVCVLFTFEKNAVQTDPRTDTASYRDAMAHLKSTIGPQIIIFVVVVSVLVVIVINGFPYRTDWM